MAKQSIQTINGKAFEYAILIQFFERLNKITIVNIIENQPYIIANKCFDSLTDSEQGQFSLISSFAVNFLIDIEPRLSHGISEKDNLQLEIVSDKQGQIFYYLFIKGISYVP
jgi:hypothetical protein